MPSVLVVTQHEPTLELTTTVLKRCGLDVVSARRSSEMMSQLLAARSDAMFLDTATCDLDVVTRLWRFAVNADPIAYISSPGDKWNRGVLKLGERDSIVTRPIDSVAIARAAQLALDLPSALPERTECGDLCLDSDSNLLAGPRRRVKLTGTEARLFRCLALAPGEFVTSSELMRTVWRIDPAVGSREMVRTHVHNLRRKLQGLSDGPCRLETLRNRGYRLVSPWTR